MPASILVVDIADNYTFFLLGGVTLVQSGLGNQLANISECMFLEK